MRTSLAIATMLGLFTLSTTADAAQKSRRIAGPIYYTAPPSYLSEKAV